jgi:hypothetical protein
MRPYSLSTPFVFFVKVSNICFHSINSHSNYFLCTPTLSLQDGSCVRVVQRNEVY